MQHLTKKSELRMVPEDGDAVTMVTGPALSQSVLGAMGSWFIIVTSLAKERLLFLPILQMRILRLRNT